MSLDLVTYDEVCQLGARVTELNDELKTLLARLASSQQVQTVQTSLYQRLDAAVSSRASSTQAQQILTALGNQANPTNQLNAIQNTLGTLATSSQSSSIITTANAINSTTNSIWSKMNSIASSLGAVKSIQQVRCEGSSGNMTSQSFRDSGNGNALNGKGRTVSISSVRRDKSIAFLSGCMWSGDGSHPGVIVSLPDSGTYVSQVHFVVVNTESFFIAQAVVVEFNS